MVVLLAQGNEGYCERVPSRGLRMLRCEEDRRAARGMWTVHPAEPSSMEARDKGWGSPSPGEGIYHFPQQRGQNFSDDHRRLVRNMIAGPDDHEVQTFHNWRSPDLLVHVGHFASVVRGPQLTPLSSDAMSLCHVSGVQFGVCP